MTKPLSLSFSMIAICDLTPAQLESLVVSLGEPAFRSRQLLRWVYGSLASSFEEMTDLPLALRQKLGMLVKLKSLIPLTERTSADRQTRKTLFQLEDGKTIESVLMTYPAAERSRQRNTVCVSTQVGCAFGCLFCATGQQGFERNLTAGEIVEQVLYFTRQGIPISNVVFMGMGEPLANFEATWQAMETMNSPLTFGLGARHLTISTVGLPRQIQELGRKGLQIGLSVSLHAANNGLRSRLIPANRKYPLSQLLAACREFSASTGRRITFEYILIHEVNDQPIHARELASLLQGLDCHVNLIPVNPTATPIFKASPRERIRIFQGELNRMGIKNTLRAGRGLDIEAGCGQLRGDRLKEAVDRQSPSPG